MMPYCNIDVATIGSGNGLLSDGTLPLPETMLTSNKVGLCGIQQRSILCKNPKYTSHVGLTRASMEEANTPEA